MKQILVAVLYILLPFTRSLTLATGFLTAAVPCLVCLLAILVLSSASAQQTLNNDSVIKMFKMGFPEEMIVGQINRSPGTYDTSPAGLTVIKNAGVGDKAVTAMVNKATAPAPPAAPTQTMPASEVAPPGTQANSHPAASTSASPASSQQNLDRTISPTYTQKPARVYVTDDPIFEHTGIVRGSSASQSSASASAAAVSGSHGSAAAAASASASSSSSSIAGFSHTQSGADPRTMEIQADIVQGCPGVIVTNDPQAANYVLTLRRKGGQRSSLFAFGGLPGLALSAGMKVNGASLFDRNGDMVYAVKERSVEDAVKKMCPYIIKPVRHS
jgi:hypothetical protein